MLRSFKPCKTPGCTELTRSKYCTAHVRNEVQVKQERDKHYDRYKRDVNARRFYNSQAWRDMREHIMLRDSRLCQSCKKHNRYVPATEVDHITPIRVDWSKRLDASNLQALCHSCHTRKTRAEQKG